MSTAIAQTKNFQERMMERVKDSIGDLITDDELKVIVEKGIDEAFFKPKIIVKEYGRTESLDPLIYKVVKELLSENVNKHVTTYMKKNPDKVEQAIQEVIKDGIGEVVLQVISNKFNWTLEKLKMDIGNIING